MHYLPRWTWYMGCTFVFNSLLSSELCKCDTECTSWVSHSKWHTHTHKSAIAVAQTTYVGFFCSNLLMKSRALSEMPRKFSWSNECCAWMTRSSVSSVLPPENGDRPLSLWGWMAGRSLSSMGATEISGGRVHSSNGYCLRYVHTWLRLIRCIPKHMQFGLS